MKRLFIFCSIFFILFSIRSYGMLFSAGIDEKSLLLGLPKSSDTAYSLISGGGEEDRKDVDLIGGNIIPTENATIINYIYDDTIGDKLDLSLYQQISNGNQTFGNYTMNSTMSDLEKNMNLSLASIYMHYLEKTEIPLKDPLWLIALGSVEYNYSANPYGIIFSFPVDLEMAKKNASYLLVYDWKEVQRQIGNSGVLRRDGSSIGIFQITSGYGANVNLVIPEEFGVLGAENGRRSDCWVTLGAAPDSGDEIIWKNGVNGDRWSPADNANIIYAVYDDFLDRNHLSPDLTTKYEKAILLMWAHNRGVGILNDSYYIQKSKDLALYVDELRTFIESYKPVRFSRSSIMKNKYQAIADNATNGDEYPVMALLSYLITEARYAGKW